MALGYSLPQHPLVEPLIERGFALLRTSSALDAHISLARWCAIHSIWRGDLNRAAQLIDELNARLDVRKVSPFILYGWRLTEAIDAWWGARYRVTAGKFDDALESAVSKVFVCWTA